MNKFMKAGVFAVLVLSAVSCARQAGMKAAAGSDQSGLLKTATERGLTADQFTVAPDFFRVNIVKVMVRQGLSDNWVTIFTGDTNIDIVAGGIFAPDAVPVEDGEYKGLAIGYRVNWVAGVTVTSNEVPVGLPSSPYDYVHTNSTATNINFVFFATSDLYTDVVTEYPEWSNTINLLTVSVPVEKGITYVLNYQFLTADMIVVTTNSNSASASFTEPDLTVTAVAE